MNNICNICKISKSSKQHKKCLKLQKLYNHLRNHKPRSNYSKFIRNIRRDLKLCTECAKKPNFNSKICNDCQRIARDKIFKKREILKIEIFSYYGNKCNCCGESRLPFLNIDHINGGGKKHVKEIGGELYRWLKKNNFPDGFQILCANCNLGKYKNGICPHKKLYS